MTYHTFMGSIPLWLVFFGTILIVLLSIEIGFRIGRKRSTDLETEKESIVGTMVAATLGLLAFLLAFTFGLAATRFETRRLNLLNEVNAIGTCYLRCDFLPKQERTEIRNLLKEYTHVRLEGVQRGEVEKAVRRSQELHSLMWDIAAPIGEKTQNSVMLGLFFQSLNELIDLHTKRAAMGLYSIIPNIIWIVLYGITILAMVELGYQIGLSGKKRSLAIPAFVITFAAVLSLIVDLDRPSEGTIVLDQRLMSDFLKSIDGQ